MQRKIKTNKAEEILSVQSRFFCVFRNVQVPFFVFTKVLPRRRFGLVHVSSLKTLHRLTRATIQLADYKLESTMGKWRKFHPVMPHAGRTTKMQRCYSKLETIREHAPFLLHNINMKFSLHTNGSSSSNLYYRLRIISRKKLWIEHCVVKAWKITSYLQKR